MAAVMCQVLPSYYSDFCEKSIFISIPSNQYHHFLITPFYCVATHCDDNCLAVSCKFHILLIGDEILPKLENFRFTYQSVDCLYSVYKYRFHDTLKVKKGPVFVQLSHAVEFNKDNKGLIRVPSVMRKRLLRKKFKKQTLRCNEKTQSTQTPNSTFMDRIQKVKNSVYEYDLLKIIDCFIDGHGVVDTDRVKFSIKS